MTKRKRYKKPLIKKLQEDMGQIIFEIMKIKNHISDAIEPQVLSFMGVFEKYLEYKNETEDFILFMEREKDNDEKEVAYKKSEAGPQKQTKRSRAPKTSGKSGKGI